MMLENAMDFRNGFVRLSYSSKEMFDETKPTYLKNLEPKLEQFSNYLGKPKIPNIKLLEPPIF